MLAFMLDTDICSYVMRRTPDHILRRFVESAGSICISSITLSELSFGAEKSKKGRMNLAEIRLFTRQMPVLAFDSRAAFHYGDIRARLEERGTPIGSNDLFIAAHARAEKLTLVTNNRREFDRVPGLKVENWA